MVGPAPPPYGGIASVMDDIVQSSLNRECEFTVFDRSPVFPPDADTPWKRTLFRAARFLTFFREVRRGGYAMVHIHSADPAFRGTTIFMMLTRIARVPILLHMHGTDWEWFYPEASFFRKAYTRFGLALPRRILVLYSLWRDNLRALRFVPEVSVFPNHIHHTEKPPPGAIEDARKRLEIEEDAFVILSVGAVGRRKGSFDILDSVPKVVDRAPSARFVLVGAEEKPGEWEQLNSIIESRGLKPWVRMTGEVTRESVPGMLGLAKAFLLPSYVEGMPIAILEAMRAGLPVISTPVNAIPDVLEDGKSGIFVKPGAGDQIADAVTRLATDEDLGRRLGEGAYARFEEKFEFSRGIEKLRQIYDEVLRGRGDR